LDNLKIRRIVKLYFFSNHKIGCILEIILTDINSPRDFLTDESNENSLKYASLSVSRGKLVDKSD